MNPAEEIVKFWLQEKGYFVQSSIKVGRKEIDILAVHTSKTKDRKHIEVQVSINSINPDTAPKTAARDYQAKKFEDPQIKEKIRERFGGDFSYAREVVKGEFRYKGKDAFQSLVEEFDSLKIKVIPFSTVLKEVAAGLGTGTQQSSIINAIQLCKKFL